MVHTRNGEKAKIRRRDSALGREEDREMMSDEERAAKDEITRLRHVGAKGEAPHVEVEVEEHADDAPSVGRRRRKREERVDG